MDDILEKVLAAAWDDTTFVGDEDGVAQGSWEQARRVMGKTHWQIKSHIELTKAAMAVHIAALEAAGWLLMPEEPTRKMRSAGFESTQRGQRITMTYKAMVAARPRLTDTTERRRGPGAG